MLPHKLLEVTAMDTVDEARKAMTYVPNDGMT